MSPRLLALASAAFLASIVACNAGGKDDDLDGDAGAQGGNGATNPFDGGGGGESDDSSGDDASGGAGHSGIQIGDGTTTSGDDCGGGIGADIFVVSSKDELVRYSPQTGSFTLIGKLDCDAGFDNHPFSMAVDRTGRAYVLYDSGDIFFVQTSDASCMPSGFQTGQHGFSTFGMGFVSNSAGSADETLYIIDGRSETNPGATNHGLADIDFNGTLNLVADFPAPLKGRPAEVTGTGDGRLFGFFVNPNTTGGGSDASVAEIDKSTANILSNVKQNLPPIDAFAFAHWGGSFYLFNANNGNSRVDKFDPMAGTTTKIIDDAGYIIVGAGVSTCAPTVPPIN